MVRATRVVFRVDGIKPAHARWIAMSNCKSEIVLVGLEDLKTFKILITVI